MRNYGVSVSKDEVEFVKLGAFEKTRSTRKVAPVRHSLRYNRYANPTTL
jgi:hypothetical protein